MCIWLFQRFNLVTDIQWTGGSVPVSEPECGFDGTKCHDETTTMTCKYLTL